MERINRFRSRLIVLIFVAILGFFAFKVYDLQIIQTGGNTDNTTTFTTLTRVKAARGDILDTNGNLLVSNRASYDLVVNHYVLLTANGTNDHLYNLVKKCQEVGITYKEHFPISQERPFTYTLDEYNSAYQDYFQKFLVYMGGLDSDITAPLLIEKLRDRYSFPEEWTDDEARQVIGLRYEMALRSCVPSLASYTFLSDASNEELSAIMELNIPGMNVEASTVREYNTKYAAHILGYVGAMNPEQWEYYKNIDGYEMDTEVGQDGLEAAYEEYLHGTDGWREDTVTADGTLVSSVYKTEPKAGSNVEISIDINLQTAAEDTLAIVIENLRNQEPDENGKLPDGHDAEGGAVVAIDVETGQMLTCASYPTYDLSRFFEDFEEIAADPYKPMYNRALMALYPPGSTYKMSMVVAGINSKAINSEFTITDEGTFDKYKDNDAGSGEENDGFAPTCLALKYGYLHGTINAAEALRDSCNYFFYVLGDMLTLDAIDSTAKGFGLGEKTGVELPEYIGHRANKETKKELYDINRSGWYPADQVLCAIGQADNRFTPIQLCVYASTLANQGNRYKATFMNRVVSADYQTKLAENKPVLLSHMDISDEAYQTYSKGMHMVASEEGGTAYKVFQNYPIDIAAKTGTAQTDVVGASDNGAFVCYAPLDDPKIAIAIYIEKGGHGSTLATIAKSMLDIYFEVGEIGDVNIFENQLS